MKRIRLLDLLRVSGVVSGAVGASLLVIFLASSFWTRFGVVLLIVGWAVLMFSSLWDARRFRQFSGDLSLIRTELRAHDERELSRTRRVESAIEAERAKESRHEYHMEQSLKRLESTLGEISARTFSSTHDRAEPAIDVLFVTSNGAGLGHVTRLLSIAQHLNEDLRFELLTLSQAYRSLEHTGRVIHYFPSADAASVQTREWNRRFSAYFATLVSERNPAVVVFDGTWVYRGLTDVCRGFGIPLVWVQRGNWKVEVDKQSVQRHDAGSVADEVIIPGDYAINETVDVGRDIEAVRTGPIVMLRRDQLLSREVACAELGLDPREKHVLINLGGGTLGPLSDSAEAAYDALSEAGSPWRAVVVRSPLSQGVDPPPVDVAQISAYPVSRYAEAFEFVVSAAGYNSVQEAVALGVPSVLVPNERSVTDDQVARAEGAAHRGLAVTARDAGQLRSAVLKLTDDDHLNQLRENLATIEESLGAVEAARALEFIVDRSGWVTWADRIGPSDLVG